MPNTITYPPSRPWMAGAKLLAAAFIALITEPRPGLATECAALSTDTTPTLAQGEPTLLNSVAWNGSQFVAAGNAILTSLDGVTWTRQATPANLNINRVIWADNQFVAVGSDSAGDTVLTSPDGTNWTPQATAAARLDGVAWNGSQFIAVGASFLTSPDATTWTPQTPDTQADLNDITWDGGQFVAVGSTFDTQTFTSTGMVLTSPDGIAWTPLFSGTGYSFADAIQVGGHFVAVGSYRPLAWIFPLINNSGTILSSADGAAWTSYMTGSHMNGVAWDGRQYVTVGTSGAVFASPDGTAWTAHSLASTKHLSGVAWNGNQFVAVGHIATAFSGDVALSPSLPTAGLILTSPDGVDWTPRFLGRLEGSDPAISCVLQEAGIPLAVGNPNGGETWKARKRYTIDWHIATDRAVTVKWVKVSFSKNGGKRWHPLKKVKPVVTHINWKPTRSNLTHNGRIQVCLIPTDKHSQRICDTSAADFVIQK